MKKITLLSLMIVFTMSVFAQSRHKNTLSSVKVDRVVNELSNTRTVIDSLHYDADNAGNAIGTGAAADFGVYAFFSAAALAGHNSVGNTITSVKVYINGVTDVSATELRFYSDTSTMVYNQVFTPIEGWNEVVLTTPFPIPATDLYIGYNLTATGGYPAGCDDATSPDPNGNWMYFGSWTHLIVLNASLTYNWNIRAMVDGILPPNPVASVTPTAWNAGDIETAANATSGTFTLTNTAGGTLTVSNATDLSATPFSTTFNAGAVSLTSGQSYDFTFSFDPTVPGTWNQTFTITSNGGNVDITLDGMAHNPYGDMLGDFENISAFDTLFPGWVQHDVDGSATYGFQGTTFPNSGYTGSFIAFNPSQTTAPMTGAAIQPHGGAQFGACFDAVTPPNDDWLVTPQHTVVTGDEIEMWVKSYIADYGLEKYEVFVSTATSDVADFTTSLSGSVLDADTIWTKDTYDLSAYVGQSVYVGIHCTSNDAFIFMIDDINFVNSTNITNENVASISMFPNPTTGILNIRNAENNSNIQIYNMMGELVLSQNNISRIVDVSNLNEGTYIVKVISKDNVATQKITLIK